jgi:DNA polymerase-4
MRRVLHLDMDSFFATVEQQARPHLRGKPVGVAPAFSHGGTIVAASIEAKRLGIKTGTRVGEAKQLAPDIALFRPDPPKYRAVHRAFRRIIADYSPIVKPRSIDEVAIWLDDSLPDQRSPLEIGAEIKTRIRREVGDYLSSSVGIGPNWLLAKTACGFKKPDGLFEINEYNIKDVLRRLSLHDLCGIAYRMEARFQLQGITTPLQLYRADPVELKRRLGFVGYYWHRRLHGLDIDEIDWGTKTLGHSSVLPRPTAEIERLLPLLQKLSERMARRLRKDCWQAGGLVLSGRPADGGRFGTVTSFTPTNDSFVLFRQAKTMLNANPPSSPLRKIAITSIHLREDRPHQASLFSADENRQRATASIDQVNDRWGDLTVHPATMLGLENTANDAIAFGQDMKTQREDPAAG